MWLGLSALLFANAIGALSSVLVKIGIQEIPPLTFTFFRFFVATVVLLPFYLHQRHIPKKKDLTYLSLNAAFYFINVSLFSIAIQYTTVIMAQIIYTVLPIAVAILGHYLVSEKMTKNKIIGLLIAMTGVFFLFQQSIMKQEVLTFGMPLGNILAFIAMLTWALYFVFSKKLGNKYSPITISFYNCIVTVALLVFTLPFEYAVRPFILEKVTLNGIFIIIFLGVISSALMVYLLQYGIKKTNAFSASLFQYTGPFFGALYAVPLLGEKVTGLLVLGGFLILLGVFYATTFESLRKYIKL